MSQDLQDLNILNSVKLEKPKLKRQPKQEEPTNTEETINNDSDTHLFSMIQNEINNLKNQLADINDFKQKMNKLTEPKPKKEKTDLQKISLQKARMVAKQNAEARKEANKLYAEQATKEFEEKVIQKAISLKKKEIKQKAQLEAISDDDTPMEKIKQISKKVDSIQTPTKPKFIFV